MGNPPTLDKVASRKAPPAKVERQAIGSWGSDHCCLPRAGTFLADTQPRLRSRSTSPPAGAGRTTGDGVKTAAQQTGAGFAGVRRALHRHAACGFELSDTAREYRLGWRCGLARIGAGARDYRIGWRLTSVVGGGTGFEVTLDATRREPANDNGSAVPAEHAVMLEAAVRW